jgi:hypothetical protein
MTISTSYDIFLSACPKPDQCSCFAATVRRCGSPGEPVGLEEGEGRQLAELWSPSLGEENT